ncbi:MAG: N-acetyltransferase [Thiothrix sp.]|nr:MAG: N-acetyltransferase [Thiothrix sp.]
MKVTTFYLEMRARDQLRAKPNHDPRLRVLEASVKQWEFNRFLYTFVGGPWQWCDKLYWDDSKWKEYLDSNQIITFVAYYDGAPAGYFELSQCDGEVEIAYFGLSPYFIGKGLGGSLLSCAIETAWNLNPRRVWVHTCTLDHPAALQNYLARGMTIYKTEEK